MFLVLSVTYLFLFSTCAAAPVFIALNTARSTFN